MLLPSASSEVASCKLQVGKFQIFDSASNRKKGLKTQEIQVSSIYMESWIWHNLASRLLQARKPEFCLASTLYCIRAHVSHDSHLHRTYVHLSALLVDHNELNLNLALQFRAAFTCNRGERRCDSGGFCVN